MGGLVFSQRTLLALTQAGISREDSYSIVQRNAMKVWESDGKTTPARTARKDIDVTVKLDKTALDKIFDYAATPNTQEQLSIAPWIKPF